MKFLHQNKLGAKEIAIRLGVTINKVYQILNQLTREEYEESSKNVLYASKEWKLLRELVLKRDGYKCVRCGAENSFKNPLQAEHKLSKAYHPELAFDLSNIITLCLRCHKRTLTWKSGSKKVGRKI